MRPIEYIWMVICVVAVICWTGITAAAAAQLKDMRIGDHGAFTRIVFEFEEASRYHLPEISGDGIASVIFPNSSVGAILPLEGLRERYRFIDSVELIKKEKDLVAMITVRSQNFEIRSFPLLSPDRVVLDFYWLQRTLAVPAIVPEQPESRTRSAEISGEPMVAKEKSGVKQMPDVIGEPMASPGYDRVQMTLMILLVVLNLVTVAILAILTVTVLKWRRWTSLTESEPVSDLLDNNIISIDSKIQEELKKYQRTR